MGRGLMLWPQTSARGRHIHAGIHPGGQPRSPMTPEESWVAMFLQGQEENESSLAIERARKQPLNEQAVISI